MYNPKVGSLVELWKKYNIFADLILVSVHDIHALAMVVILLLDPMMCRIVDVCVQLLCTQMVPTVDYWKCAFHGGLHMLIWMGHHIQYGACWGSLQLEARVGPMVALGIWVLGLLSRNHCWNDFWKSELLSFSLLNWLYVLLVE